MIVNKNINKRIPLSPQINLARTERNVKNKLSLLKFIFEVQRSRLALN